MAADPVIAETCKSTAHDDKVPWSARYGDKALSSVTAINAGLGSCAATASSGSTRHLLTIKGVYDNVFIMLYLATAAAGLFLTKVAYRELYCNALSVMIGLSIRGSFESQ